MKPWLMSSLAAVCLWGLWGFFGKLASRSVSSVTLLLVSAAGGAIIFPVFLAIFGRRLEFAPKNVDFWFALCGGMVGAIGGLFFFLAISNGEASRVVATTATYPIVTVILAALFLRETIGPWQIAGIALAVTGVCLLSWGAPAS